MRYILYISRSSIAASTCFQSAVIVMYYFNVLYEMGIEPEKQMSQMIATSIQRSLLKISHHKKIGYNINVLQQTACLVVSQITVGNFNCTLVGRTSDSMRF